LFKNGNCEVAFVKAGNTVGTNFAIYAYCNGKSVLQANTWVNPIGGKLIIIGDETGLSYWLSNHLLTAPKVDANFITTYGGNIAEAVSDRFVFADTIANSRFVGCLNDLMLIDGIASQLSNEQILEYFTTDDPTELSFWDNVTHFYNCGEDSYPDILDLKGAQDMELVDGLENDFKLK